MRAVDDLTVADEGRSLERDESGRGVDLPATELSPSLLAIEAEVRGVRLQADRAEELQQEIYQELANAVRMTRGEGSGDLIVKRDGELCPSKK
jgi:hypothetical protein